MTSTDVSVVIPTCDRPGSLNEAIESVRRQTERPLETIVVDNGRQPCLDQIEHPDDIRYVRIVARAGVSQARNSGVAHATGRWIAFLDDDDLWPPDYLSTVVAAMQGDSHVDCWITRKDQVRDGQAVPYKEPTDARLNAATLLRVHSHAGGSNIVARKIAIESVGGFDVRLPSGEDHFLIVDLLLNDYVVKGCGKVAALTRPPAEDDDRLNTSPTANAVKRLVRLVKYRRHLTDDVHNAWFSSALRELLPYAPGATERGLMRLAAVVAKRRNAGRREEVDAF